MGDVVWPESLAHHREWECEGHSSVSKSEQSGWGWHGGLTESFWYLNFNWKIYFPGKKPSIFWPVLTLSSSQRQTHTFVPSLICCVSSARANKEWTSANPPHCPPSVSPLTRGQQKPWQPLGSQSAKITAQYCLISWGSPVCLSLPLPLSYTLSLLKGLIICLFIVCS